MSEELDLISQMDKAISDHHSNDGTIDPETAKRLSEAIPEYEADPEEEAETIQDANVVQDAPLSADEKANIKKSADRWVRAFNSLQKLIYPRLYKKKILKPGDQEIINDYIRKKETSTDPRFLEDAVTADDRLYHTLKRYETLEKSLKRIPLTKEEKEELAEPLAELMEKRRSLVMGPEMSLIISAVIVTLPRLEPFFPDIMMLLDDE
jgi:hypothetical protein